MLKKVAIDSDKLLDLVDALQQAVLLATALRRPAQMQAADADHLYAAVSRAACAVRQLRIRGVKEA
jgi:hypothetical protein